MTDEQRNRHASQRGYGQTQPTQSRNVSNDQARAQARARLAQRQGQRPAARNVDTARYRARNYQGRKQSSGLPVGLIIAALVVVVALVAVCMFALRSCGSVDSDKVTATQASSAPLAVKDASQPVQEASAGGDIVIALKGGDVTLVQKGEQYIEPGCSATDVQDGLITENVQISGKVDANKAGEYKVTYTVKNSRGQQSKRERTVKVVDNMEKNTAGVPVMMYHYVYTQDDQPDSVDGNYILDTDLEDQLKWLTENDYYFPSFAELRAYVDGKHSLPAKSIVLTFDDGEPGCLQYGGALMEKYKVPMISFLVCWDNSDAAVNYANPYINFESHTYNMHRAGGNAMHGGIITAMDVPAICDDLQKAADLLHSNDAVAYPFGDAPGQGVEAMSKNGVLCAFTTNYGMTHPGDNPGKLDRIRVQGQASLSAFIASING